MRFALLILCITCAHALAAPSLELTPGSPRPGDPVAVTVRGADVPPIGFLGDRGLSFFPIPGGYRAFAAIAVDHLPGLVTVTVTFEDEATPTVYGFLEVAPAAFRTRELTVASKYVSPPSSVKQRMAADQE